MASPRTMAAAVAGASAISLAVALCVVDCVSWRRTRDLRRGRHPAGAGAGRREGGRTSRWTLLAGAIGASATLWGALRWSVPGAAAGALVAVEGFRARVVAVLAGPGGLRIRYRWRRPAVLPWGSVVRVRPPRTPLGAWVIATAQGARRRLMGSDVLGLEVALRRAVAAAELRFEGREWQRPRPAGDLSRP